MSVSPSTTTGAVLFFDVTDPHFSITSEAVHAAREQSWYATTPYGIAVLRYEQMNSRVQEPPTASGQRSRPAHNGVTEGPFARWWDSWIPEQGGRGAPSVAPADESGLRSS